jgi:hypothetical protein
VQYRGLFLNDEDWGLQPWAAKTYEPKTGDIGPKTYSRIFELMWRLKANTIWPAMHDVTKPFYTFPGNPKAADDYAIVVGTSHAEPMMRNNVGEWDEKTRGEFNFLTNRDGLTKYWQERASEAKAYENIYSLGLRGIHDSPMEGANVSPPFPGRHAHFASQVDHAIDHAAPVRAGDQQIGLAVGDEGDALVALPLASQGLPLDPGLGRKFGDQR